MRSAHALLVLLAALIPLAAPALAYQTTVMVVRSQSVIAPAVTMTPLGGFKGTISIFDVAVAEPGKGIVYISTRPRTEVDFQATSRIAAIIAAIFAGKNFNKYDFFVSVKSNSSIIGGPSAGGLTATTFMALLLKLNMTNTTSMTGLICPDGTIGPVGGVASKLEAAARAGIKTFIIPKGEVIVTEPRVVNETYTSGNETITRITVKQVKFNLTRLAEKLHVKLVQAGSIIDTLYYFTGYNITKTMNMTAVRQAIRSASTYWMRPARILIERAKNTLTEIRSTEVNITNAAMLAAFRNATRLAESLVSKAEQLYAAGKYYAAASDAFRAWYEALYAHAIQLTSKYYQSGADLKHAAARVAETLVNNATRVMDEAYREFIALGNKTCTNILELQLLSSVYERIDEANTTILSVSHVIETLTSGPVPAPTPTLLNLLSASAYVVARAHSALDWLGVARTSIHTGYCIPVAAIRSELYTLNQFASDLTSYLYWLGAPIHTMGLIPPLSNTYLLERASKAYQVAEATSRIVSTLSRVMVAIHQMYNTTRIQLPDIALNTRYLLGRLVDDKINPLVPAIYVELASALPQPEAKLDLYERAAAYSLLLYVLGTKFAAASASAAPATPTAAAIRGGHGNPVLLGAAGVNVYTAILVAAVAAATAAPHALSRRRK